MSDFFLFPIHSLQTSQKFSKLTDNVFPDPVCATPTISNPLRATGHPWAWIAVGSVKFCLAITSMMFAAISSNLEKLVMPRERRAFFQKKENSKLALTRKVCFIKIQNWLWAVVTSNCNFLASSVCLYLLLQNKTI